MRRSGTCAFFGMLAACSVFAAVQLENAASVAVTFGNPQAQTVQPLAVRLAQISADAALDAFVTSSGYPDYYTCRAGNGDGTFGAAIGSGTLRADAADLVAGDFNKDGIVDFAAVCKTACG